MAYVLGILDRGDGALDYFVHCTSSGFSFPRLFASPEAARRTLDQEGMEALIGESASPESATVARLSICDGWSAESGHDAAELWGLASTSQLLTPLDVEDGSLQMALTQDLAHIACEVSVGPDREETRAFCEPEKPLPGNAYLAPASDPILRSRRLCPDCIVQVSGVPDSV